MHAWHETQQSTHLRRFAALADLPTLHLIIASREEVYELDGAKAGGDDLGQHAGRPRL